MDWEGFGEGLGSLVGNFLNLFLIFLGFVAISHKKLFLMHLGWFRESFGRVCGGFWEGSGRVWEPLGRRAVLCRFP